MEEGGGGKCVPRQHQKTKKKSLDRAYYLGISFFFIQTLFFPTFSSYQVIVLKVTDGVEKLPDDYAERLNSASVEKLNFYIAAEIDNVPVHVTSWKFTVGNEQPYKEYMNKKLENGQEYVVYQRAITRDNNVS